ncbi:MAG: hypothetical protein AAB426_04280, partial [Myxococcota bacterium]
MMASSSPRVCPSAPARVRHPRPNPLAPGESGGLVAWFIAAVLVLAPRVVPASMLPVAGQVGDVEPTLSRAFGVYDPQGKVLSASYPGGLALNYGYNARTLLQSIQGGFGAVAPYVGNFSYDVRGLPLRSDYDNGLVTCRWFDDRGRLTAGRTGP